MYLGSGGTGSHPVRLAARPPQSLLTRRRRHVAGACLAAHQRRRRPGPARRPQLHRHRPQARPPAPRRPAPPVHRQPLAATRTRPRLSGQTALPESRHTAHIKNHPQQPGECLPNIRSGIVRANCNVPARHATRPRRALSFTDFRAEGSAHPPARPDHRELTAVRRRYVG